MNSIRTVAIRLCVVLTTSVALAACAQHSAAPVDSELTKTVTVLDSNLFNAYNQCDLSTLARYIAPNLEFYHDKGGLTIGRDKLVESVKNNICGKLRRELIPGTLEVYPIKGFGALEIGAHRFCEVSTGNCDAVARFIHLWQFRDGNWSLTRVISYDHRTD